jgi:DNA-binding response OmpR family regulator
MKQSQEQNGPSSSRAPRVLIVEDNEDLRIIYSDTLTHHGYRILVAADGEETLALAEDYPPDLALIDIDLPGMSGREVAAWLRGRYPEVAIIFVTALDEVEVAVEEMHRGAFYYLTKPVETCRLLEVVEKAWAACRARAVVRVEGLVVDLREGRAILEGEPLPLTPRESEMLVCLARRRGEVVSYEELWGKVWEYDGPLAKGVIQRAVSRLREKLSGEGIVCVRRRGYRLG